MEYRPTIGLEVHAELKTRTKMFCDSKNDPDEKEPNVNICPICMGHPGTLPTINKMAVKHVLKVGIAVGGELADFTEFDRKNYFYPDLPKGYQISQYKYPLVKGGELGGVKLTRIHLEEDTARSLHEEGDFSLIDYNRAGVPLMELVTEPVIKSAEEAGHFARELQLLLRTLQAGEANMEKGEMRVEANISVSADEKLGTKVEVKNLNSFRSVESAIHYEIQRHAALLERGEKIVQETRGWDEEKQETYSQRLKEESHDYRYFPEPDLPKLYIRDMPEFAQDKLKKEIPELPEETRKRYQLSFGLKKEDTEVLLTNEPLRTLFEGTASRFKDDPPAIQLAANYLTSDLVGLIRGKDEEGGSPSNITKDSFIKLIGMTRSGKITSRIAKNILLELFNKGGDPESIANRDNLFKKSGEPELKSLAETIITDYPKAVNEYRNGKVSVLAFLLGKGMEKTGGTIDPVSFERILRNILSPSDENTSK